jgi:hypothetical protein
VVPPDVPVTLIEYEPTGVPLGLGVPPEFPPEPPQPAASSTSSRANVLTGTNVRTRRLRTARRATIEIPRTISVSGHRLRRIPPFGPRGGTLDVREVVVMTNEAVEFAETDTAGHAAPVGNPEQVRVYERAPTSVIVNVADEPAATVLEEGEALKDDGLPLETFRRVFPPGSEPKGATRM